VTYEVGVFGPLKEGGQGQETALPVASAEVDTLLEDGSPAVVGGFTHVFVSRDSRRSVKSIPTAVVQGLTTLEKGAPLSRL
jgi:hypothetical protein